MLKQIIQILIGMFLAIGVTHAPALALTVTDATKPIVVQAKNPNFQVVLKANATTGFQWFLLPKLSDLSQIELVSYHYIASTTALMGAPGEAVFTFRIKSLAFVMPQRFQLAFSYQRPWEIETNPPTYFTIFT